jgi:hypothetical protein
MVGAVREGHTLPVNAREPHPPLLVEGAALGRTVTLSDVPGTEDALTQTTRARRHPFLCLTAHRPVCL